MDQLARRDVLAGEADDLPVLADGLALLDGDEGDLVPQPDALAESDAQHLGPVGQVARGDGDVVLGTEMHGGRGHGRSRCGWRIL